METKKKNIIKKLWWKIEPDFVCQYLLAKQMGVFSWKRFWKFIFKPYVYIWEIEDSNVYTVTRIRDFYLDHQTSIIFPDEDVYIEVPLIRCGFYIFKCPFTGYIYDFLVDEFD
ncbi:MAG: hypothetical protein HQ541_20705 [Mariniphaga sp.]|nr:hypothetical protein [Mariniphaga sp.]